MIFYFIFLLKVSYSNFRKFKSFSNKGKYQKVQGGREGNYRTLAMVSQHIFDSSIWLLVTKSISYEMEKEAKMIARKISS